MPLLVRRNIRMAASIAAVLALPHLAPAGTINFAALDFSSPVVELGSDSVTIPSGTIAGQYTLAATLSFASNILDLSGVQITCSNPGISSTCGSLDLEFEALSGSGSGNVLLVAPSLSGSGSASGFARVCLADTQDICSSDGSGSQSVTIPFSGSISGTASNSFNLINGFNVLGDFHLDGLPSNGSVSLTDSFAITFVSASFDSGGGPGVGAPVPEPRTLMPMSLGMLSLIIGRALRIRTQRDKARKCTCV